MLDVQVEGARYILRGDVEIIRRSTTLLLFGRRDERTVRASPAAALLLPLLQEGADFERLRDRLQSAQPAAADIRTKLAAFLATLVQSGLVLDSSGTSSPAAGTKRRDRFPLIELDPIAASLARPLAPLVGRAGALLVLLAVLTSAGSIAWAAVAGKIPPLPQMVEQLNWAGVLLFFLLVVPVHELGHAVACRLAGAQVGKAGILLHGGIVPGPFVDTSQAYRVTDKWRRLMIPAAGPLVNLAAAGLVAAMLAAGSWDAAATSLLQGLLLFSLMFVYFDTNPFAPSDGSHCLEAVLEDELARRHALRRAVPKMTDAQVVRKYRLAMVAHTVIAVGLFSIWWG